MGRYASLPLLKKALDQWIDGADDRVTRAAFVVGEPSGAGGALVGALGSAEGAWALPDGSLAHADHRLRSPRVVDTLLELLPADVAVFDAIHDSHVLDRLLALHADSRAVWLYRPWQEVAALAPDPADTALVGAIVRDEPIEPPLPEGLRERLRAALPSAPGPVYAAVTGWIVRVARLMAHRLHTDPRVLMVHVADLAREPEAAVAGISAFLGLAAPSAVRLDVPVPGDPPSIAESVVSLADALHRTLVQATSGEPTR
jgi:hypothetical protein